MFPIPSSYFFLRFFCSFSSWPRPRNPWLPVRSRCGICGPHLRCPPAPKEWNATKIRQETDEMNYVISRKTFAPRLSRPYLTLPLRKVVPPSIQPYHPTPYPKPHRDVSYIVVRHAMIWYGMVWHGMLCYAMLRYGAVWYGIVRWNRKVWEDAVRCGLGMVCSAIWSCHKTPYHIIPYNTIPLQTITGIIVRNHNQP